MTKLSRLIVLAAATILWSAAPTQAATISFEELGDSTCVATATATTGCTDTTRDLYRIRQVGAGPGVTENTDATLLTAPGASGAGGNSIDANFGVYNNAGLNVAVDVSYIHVTTWLPTNTFTEALLTIYAYGPGGNNDIITADIVLDNLVMGTGITTTTFSSVNFPDILVQLLDGQLAVSLDKTNNDEINLFRSRLTVTYEDVSTLPGVVPEPASMLLLGTGLAGLAARRYRRRRTA